MIDLTRYLDPALDAEAKAFLAEAVATLGERGASSLPVLWPRLARSIGRAPLDAGRVEEHDAVADLSAGRALGASPNSG